MTIQEASSKFHIKMESLQFYLENGLLEQSRTEDGIPEFIEEDLQCAVQFRFLLDAGMDIATLKQLVQLMKTKADTVSEQVRILRKCRYQLLEEIHGKQQCLDQLDYYIHEIRQKQTKKEA